MAGKQEHDYVYGAVTTTNTAASTQLASFATASGVSYYVKIRVIARVTAGGTVGDTSVWEKACAAKNVGGTLTVVVGGGSLSTFFSNSDSSLNTTTALVVASGTNIVINVTGLGTATIDWIGEIDIVQN